MGLQEPRAQVSRGTVPDMTRAEYNRDLLEQDERMYGVAFVEVMGRRVDPEKVFKSVANTYVDYQGRNVSLWKSETA